MIRGKKVILRTFQKEDLIPFMEVDDRAEEQGPYRTPRMNSLHTHQKSFDKTGFWEEKRGWMLICDLSGRFIGSIGYFSQNLYVSGFEVGFRIFLRSDRGKGYTTEALRLFTAFMFLSRDIPRLQIITDTENLACRKVAEKCGYQYEGTLRQYSFVRGEHRDHVIYSMLRHECPEAPELQGV